MRAVVFSGAGLLSLSLAATVLLGCVAPHPAAPAASSPAPYYDARPRVRSVREVMPAHNYEALAEREQYALANGQGAPKAAPAPSRARRKPVASDIAVAVNPPSSPVPASLFKLSVLLLLGSVVGGAVVGSVIGVIGLLADAPRREFVKGSAQSTQSPLLLGSAQSSAEGPVFYYIPD
jgi:hypothetical protein